MAADASAAPKASAPLSARVIDFHTHLLPKSWPDPSRRYGYGGFFHMDHAQSEVSVPGNARLLRDSEPYLELGPNCWDAQIRVDEMDAAGVDLQVVSTIPEMFSYWAKADDAADLARILNNAMADQMRAHPARFLGLATLPLQAPELAVAELTRCMKELRGFAGAVVGTHINDWALDAPELTALWEAAEELGAVVFVHPNDLETKGPAAAQDCLMPRVVGQSAEVCHAVASVLAGGLLDQFPKLKVCFANGAGTFPYVREQLEHALAEASGACDVDALAAEPPSSSGQRLQQLDRGQHLAQAAQRLGAQRLGSEAYRGRLMADSVVRGRDATDLLLQALSSEAVVFGSDHPAPLGGVTARGSGGSGAGKYGLAANEALLHLSEEDRERVMGGNAALLLQDALLESVKGIASADEDVQEERQEDGAAGGDGDDNR